MQSAVHDPAPLPHRHLHVALRCTAPVPLHAEFDCAPGELVALVGPSGSGKTTLLRAIAGLYRAPGMQGVVHWTPSPPLPAADSATAPQTVWFDSARGIALAPQARRVGLVFQQYALFPHLSALENVAACAAIDWSQEQKQTQSMALLARMGLADLAHRLPHQLSGGQQQRVALARALVRLVPPSGAPGAAADPSGVLLLDEPFSAVDAPMRQVLYRELAQLHASLQLPIVLVTHDLSEARRLADKVVIVDGGSTLQSGPPERLLRSPRNARVAALVGIHNHFSGQFYTAPAPAARDTGVQALQADAPKTATGIGQLHWGRLVLQVPDKGRIANATPVTWVMAGDLVQVLGADDAGRATPATSNAAEQDNLLPCRLVEMLPLGEICVCKLAVHGAPDGDSVVLNLSTAVLRSLHASVGAELLLCLPVQALHIMPLR